MYTKLSAVFLYTEKGQGNSIKTGLKKSINCEGVI
jgi:hypothetical protein